MSEPLLLVVRSEPLESAREAEYHRWYAQHVEELVGVPGVLSGRRFACIDGDMRFMAMYSIADAGVFDTPEYRKIKGFGPIEPHIRFTRNVYRDMPLEGPK